MNILRITLCAAFAVAAIAPAVAADTPKVLTVTMKAENGSKEEGVATIKPSSDGVTVTVLLKNAKSLSQPTHIHAGTCDNITKAPEFALVNTTDGKGTTDVKGVTIEQLLSGKYAINVHKSANELATYVSCGNITAMK